MSKTNKRNFVGQIVFLIKEKYKMSKHPHLIVDEVYKNGKMVQTCMAITHSQLNHNDGVKKEQITPRDVEGLPLNQGKPSFITNIVIEKEATEHHEVIGEGTNKLKLKALKLLLTSTVIIVLFILVYVFNINTTTNKTVVNIYENTINLDSNKSVISELQKFKDSNKISCKIKISKKEQWIIFKNPSKKEISLIKNNFALVLKNNYSIKIHSNNSDIKIYYN